ncbi:MAG TPA: beta-phosphoglucomutase [Cyclobacteriaceae bacterium]|nr:beta-phosphoglucomutase [Cyclobacteriaceae bacterium]HMV09800.1 beta-phosphoglucomutase [Cyclobacteriaceae bacterium]HMV89728.1 beta-phosphoglucomutase [Cyclobacteriaceae bacterium]HMX00490.1 beta-phosphoglucomutase [Cyclobacteriaceae bacterium]HMX50426.1 beta-phosphoglucomutase [Cyclobacteriaceae bacterium]
MIKACIFDLDGVLVDTAHYHFLAWKRLAKEFDYELTEEINEELKGVSRMKSLEIVLNHANVSLENQKKELMADRKNTWFTEYVHNMNPDELFPGVRELFGRLKKDNIRIALASSSKNAQTIIEILGIQNEFETVVDGTMIVHSKPDPEIFLLAARKLNLKPADCVVFEDAEAGVEAALAAGMKCVGIGNPAKLKKANRIVDAIQNFNYSDLQKL